MFDGLYGLFSANPSCVHLHDATNLYAGEAKVVFVPRPQVHCKVAWNIGTRTYEFQDDVEFRIFVQRASTIVDSLLDIPVLTRYAAGSLHGNP